MRAERPRIAVIGVGQRGAALARRFHDLGALSVLCDPDDLVLKNLVDNYPDIETTLSPVAVLKNKSIRGVVIATPGDARFDLAREALIAGKHVYVECPPTLHTKEAEVLATAACEQKLIFMVGNPVRYNPAFIRLRQVADSGELGRIRYIYSHRLGSCGEGTFEPFPPQDVSMVLALAGGEPSSVMATGGRYLDGSAIDPVLTQLEFSSGLRAHILVSQNYPFPVRKLVVAGDSRTAVFDDAAPWKDKLTLHVNGVDGADCIAPTKSAEPERVRIPADEPIGAACEHFLHCIYTANRPITDGSEWLRVVRVIELGLDSLGGKRGRVLAPFSSDSMVHITANNPQRDSCKSAHIHPSAIIDDGCKIGAGSRIWHFAHIMSNAQIGEDCSVGQNVIIGQDVKIGKRCKIQNNVSIYKGVTLEDSVFCGPSVVFTNVYRPRAELGSIDQARPTLIEKGASIGANATIVCGVTIGRYALVGAGAVVNRNVPDFAVVAGNPAKQIGWACVCGEPLTSELECRTCRRMYEPCFSGLKEKAPDTAEANHY